MRAIGRAKRNSASPEHDMKIAPKSMGIARADGMPHTDGRGRTDAERHHISEAGYIQGNLVSGELYSAQFADQKRCRSKSANFQQQLQRRRQTQSQQLANTR